MIDKQPSDFLGRVIAIGEDVVYPTRRKSDMWLCRGTVKDFRYHDDLSKEPWTLDVLVECVVGTRTAKRVAKNIPARRCVKV